MGLQLPNSYIIFNGHEHKSNFENMFYKNLKILISHLGKDVYPKKASCQLVQSHQKGLEVLDKLSIGAL